MPNLYTGQFYSEGIVDFKSMRGQVTKLNSDKTSIMTASSNYFMVMDGTGFNRLVRLPDATSLSIGHTYYFVNDSTQIVPIQSSDSSSFTSMYPNTRTQIILKDNTSSKGAWISTNQNASTISSNFSVIASYGASAAVGRYLEIYPSQSSDVAPYLISAKSAITTLTLGAVSSSTGTLGIFLTTDLVNPITTISLSASTSNTLTGLYVTIDAGTKLAAKVTSGTIAKPFAAIYIANV